MIFKTKFELDKHVGKILMRARTDSDKNKEGLKISKLYYDIKEYETADFYLTNYLSEFTFDAFAWKLKAEIAELSEKNWTKAMDYYIKSFKSSDESDSKLLLKICNCFIQTEKFDFFKAKEWLDRAIKLFPNDKIIINLQEKLFNNIELLGEKELNQWETFLVNAINENCIDQELNLKFINISLKNKNYSKAFKHLIKIEYKSLFERDSKWPGLLFNLINSYIENQEEFNKFDKSTKLIFYLMAINYMTGQIFGSIQKDDLLVLKYSFLRLDKFIIKFENEKLLDLKENFGKIVYNEIVSQYVYILGLLFLKHETIKTDDMSADDNKFSNETKAGLFLMAKSLSLSKPNASFLSQDVSQKTRQDPVLRLLFNDYAKLLHRESCWRYSSIGNWIKFLITKKFSNDSSKVLELINLPKQNLKVREFFTAFLNIGQTEDFLLCQNEHFFDSNITNIYETNTLDYADKNCLENQSFNLNYLVWHGLSNTKFTSKCDDLTEIPAYFYFRSTKNSARSTAKFGVENLNICNLESLSLMDLKVFYYSVFYQTLSKLKSVPGFALRPFWLESNLPNPHQSDWWLHSAQEVLRSKTGQYFMSSSLDDFCFFTKIDSKKQTEILKILELIRLKNPSVKIQTGIRNEMKYKIDLEIVIFVAKYFQFLNDSIDCLNVTQSNIERDTILQKYGQSFVALNSEVSHSPKEKQFYIKNYLLRYWNFTLKQLIKLKQVCSSVEDYISEPLSDTFVLNESTMNSTSQANQYNLYENYFIFYKAQEREKLSPVKLLPKNRPSPKDLKLFSPESTSLKSTIESPYFFDSAIQSALLNSILIQTLPDYPADEMHTFQNLNEAINTFDLVEESLDKKWKNELNLYHLQVCKKLAETLVLQRDALISLKSKNTEGCFQRNMNENLDKIQTLIELTKNKINIAFNKPTKHESIQTDRILESINASFENSFIYDLVENAANTSISESIKNIEQFFEYKAENTPEAIRKRAEYEEEQRLKEELENEERRRIEEEEERKRLELEDKLKKEREEELKRQKELEEQVKRQKEEKERQEREEKEQLMKELKIHQEKIKKLEQNESLRWSKQKEEIEMEKIRLRNEINEEMNKKVKEFEAKQKKSADQMDSSYKSDKITGLIDTLNKQRSQYFEMNKETLKEQFSFIKNQNSKINNEIKQLRLSTNNRRKSLIDFKQIVTNFNEICDIKLYNSRFSIFYWLFQQNPNLAQSMWHQQNVMNEIKKCQMEKKPLIPEVKTPTRNQTKMNETSFLSANEFQTPDTRLNQISFLEKPIGDIKFPSNFNMIEQLRKSADAFNSSQQSLEHEEEEQYESEEEYDDDDENFDNEEECYDDEEDYYDDQNYEEDESDGNRPEPENTKQDTFLSCEDFDLTKSELSKVSMNELQILFSQNGYLYTYDIEKRLWMTKGKCKLEVIGDEISQKGDFKAHMICNVLDENRVYEFDVTRFTNLNDFKNSNSAVYWFETKKALNNCCEPAGVRFENESIKNEFKNLIEKCQKNMENNKSKLETRSSNSLLYPSDLLPEDLVGKFEKQITFVLNENLRQPCVVLNITPIDKVFFLTIKQNDSVIFKHIIASDQTYEIREKPKLRQHIFKYKISGDQVRVDYLSERQANDTTVYDICLAFSSSPALMEFINVLNLKK